MKISKLLACVLISGAAMNFSMTLSAQPSGITTDEASFKKQYGHAVELFDKGMFDRARIEFEQLHMFRPDVMVDGYQVLCAVNMQSLGYEKLVADYEEQYPYSVLLPKIRFQYGLVLFDKQDYLCASREFSYVDRSEISRKQLPEYLYKRAYCDYRNGDPARAKERFTEVSGMRVNNYTGPARYALGYLNYDQMNFREAVNWFELASKDSRFTDVSDYYIVDCRFMLKDYDYVVKKGPAVLEAAAEERRGHLARIIAESYLVKGDVEKAKSLYDSVVKDAQVKTRSDHFFAGSVMYAAQDWQGAIESFSQMGDRTDSIGQIANYNMAYSYIRTRNKVEAMNCFRSAAKQTHDPVLAEDAMFNWAKLAFDLNNDSSVFSDYIAKYPIEGKSDRIYSYIAVAALRNRDYVAAVDAFDKIDELDGTMRRNYMKSNFLRASQLIADESYADAIPYLKAAAYYSEKNGQLNQLARYWLAESYYRSGNYADAQSLYTDLYNVSALDGQIEGSLIPYNLAYCYFKDEEYSRAVKWYDVYLGSGSTDYAKGASLRKGDCYFMQKKYDEAAKIYEKVVDDYRNVNDIYPYYQAGVCYGLMGKNSKKIDALLPVRQANQESRYYSEAVFELGRAYVAAKRDADAKSCFNQLMDNPVDSAFYARSAIEMGMMCRNGGDYAGALEWYKKVVREMPLSRYSDDALAAIESVYEAQGAPQLFLDYISSIGRSNMKTEAEKEQMIFNAAEQAYLAQDYGRALKSLEDYLAQYPGGVNNSNAYFYMAESYKGLGQKEKACASYSKVVELGSDSFLELAMLNFAQISFDLQRYDDAFGGYHALLENARMEVNKYTAEVGMMRAAYRAKRYDDAIAAASVVKADIRSESAMVREADYVTAKSYLQTSLRDDAFLIFNQLAKQPRTSEGAEACYLIILDAYDRGFFTDAINKTFDFSEQTDSSQEYWLAKAFIVLGDCYAEQGDVDQAKATLKSILDGYSRTDDDIIENVKIRLSKL